MVPVSGEREERGKEGHRLRQRLAVLREEPFQFEEILLGGLRFCRKSQFWGEIRKSGASEIQ